MTSTFFKDITACFEALAQDTSFRVVVLSAVGKYFSVGFDLKESGIGSSATKEGETDPARNAYRTYKNISSGLAAFSALERYGFVHQ